MNKKADLTSLINDNFKGNLTAYLNTDTITKVQNKPLQITLCVKTDYNNIFFLSFVYHLSTYLSTLSVKLIFLKHGWFC